MRGFYHDTNFKYLLITNQLTSLTDPGTPIGFTPYIKIIFYEPI